MNNRLIRPPSRHNVQRIIHNSGNNLLQLMSIFWQQTVIITLKIEKKPAE